jgi:hypothetical protein
MSLTAGVMDELELRSNSSMTPAGSDIGEFSRNNQQDASL